MMGIEQFKHMVQTTRSDRFESLEELKPYLQKELNTLIPGAGLAPGINRYITCKAMKVTSYVTRKGRLESL